jgi:tetratricopeptide (TPR) repeat protein/predicted Ser/Thr protein kinase
MATRPDLEREERLDRTIAAYLEAQERGEAPDPRTWVARHPDLAEELEAFLADQLQFDSLVAPLRPAPSDSPPTIATGRERTEVGRFTLPVAGESFGDYQLLEEIARGGMGVVFKARQVSLNRTVAVKMLLAGRLAAPQDVYRFQREAEGAAQLDHPNIVPIFEVGEHQGRAYFSMKYIEGGNLTQHVRRLSQDPRAAARLVLAIARAVDHAHQRGLLHRDLKPANILLENSDRPLVTDFGLAKIVRREELALRAPAVDGAAPTTETGTTLGTPSYMAPEQAFNAKSVTTAADVYSLGAILYELLTGQPPFRGDSPFATLMAAVEREPIPPRTRNPRVPRDLETVCLKCLQKVPAQRYVNAAALADDLQRFLDGEGIAARPAGRLERFRRWVRRHPALAGMAVVFLLAAAGAYALLYGEMQRTHQEFVRAEGHFRDAQQNLADARFQAERARRNFEEAEKERAAARQNERQARRILDDLYVRFNEKLAQFPGTEKIRRELLNSGLKYYQEFLKQRGDDPELQEEVADAYHQIGWIATAVGSRADALKAHEKALALYQKALDARPRNSALLRKLASSWHNVGWMRKGTQQPTAFALEAYDKARTIYEDLLERRAGTDDELAQLKNLLANTLNNIGSLHDASGHLGLARANYNRALELRLELDRDFPDNPKSKSGLAQSYHNLGILTEHLGNRPEALKLFEKERDLRALLVKRFPKNLDYQSDLASSWFHIGVTHSRLEKKANALKAYEQARKLREKVARMNPSVIGYQVALATSHLSHGHTARDMKRLDQALESYTQAQKVLEQAAQTDPDHANLCAELGKAHFNVGHTLARLSRPDEALDSYEKARLLQEKMVTNDPGYLEFRHDLQLTLNNYALLCSDLKDHDKARELAREALKHQKFLYDRNLKSADHRHGMAMRYATLAEIERRAGNGSEAFALHLERREYCTGNVTDLRFLLHDLGNLAEQVGSGKAELTEAEREERQKITTAALETLRQLLKEGHRDFRWLETARELAAVRERPEFPEIVREFKN